MLQGTGNNNYLLSLISEPLNKNIKYAGNKYHCA